MSWRLLWGESFVASDAMPQRADVVVVGAGIAGVTAALELRKSGREVLLIEARRAGAGTTGRTTAKATAGHARIYADLVSRSGEDSAALYARGQQEALTYFARAIRFPALIQRVDHHVFADGASDQLLEEFEVTRRLGLPTQWNDQPNLPGAHTAITYKDQFQINPTAWLSTLLEEFQSLGGRYVTGVRVKHIEDGSPVVVRWADGELSCRDVVVATHFPISHQVLGAPRLSTQMALVVAGPSTLDVTDTWISEDDSLSVRSATDEHGRVVVISGEPFRNGAEETPALYHRLSEVAQMRFGITELRYYWSAHDLHTEDRMPYVGLQLPNSQHVWVASGFGSWGMTNGTLSGLMLAKMLTSGAHPLQDLFDPRRIGFVPPAAQTLRESGEAIKHLVGERIARTFDSGEAENLSPGQGTVVREGGSFVAVHRDTDGALHKVSAACTHLGCLVAWNQADQTWDCPCHGSRFEGTGEVIEGPAATPLKPL